MSLIAVLGETNFEVNGVLNANEVRVKTTTGGYDSTYRRYSYYVYTGYDAWQDLASAESYLSSIIWMQLWQDPRASNSGYLSGFLTLRDSVSDDLIFGFRTAGYTLYIYSYNDAGAAVSTTVGVTSAPAYLDLKFDVPNDTVTVYENDSKLATLSLDLNRRSAGTLIGRVSLEGESTNQHYTGTAIVTKNEASLGWRLKSLIPNAAGTYTDWTGAYTDIDEISLSDADLNTINAAGTQTYGYSDMSAPTGFDIYGVIVSTVCNATSGTVNKVVTNQVYTNSTLYDLGTGVDVEVNQYAKAVWDIYLVNPDTSAAWTYTEINAAEFGFKSST